DGATLRPSDFVHFVRNERVEDPVAANVRVMTVHQAKGLEFDIVVLPELDAPLVRATYQEIIAYRPHPGARVTRAFPYVHIGLRSLFSDLPELQEAHDQLFRNELRDGLSILYVALTRARHPPHGRARSHDVGSRRCRDRARRSAVVRDGAVAARSGDSGTPGADTGRRRPDRCAPSHHPPRAQRAAPRSASPQPITARGPRPGRPAHAAPALRCGEPRVRRTPVVRGDRLARGRSAGRRGAPRARPRGRERPDRRGCDGAAEILPAVAGIAETRAPAATF